MAKAKTTAADSKSEDQIVLDLIKEVKRRKEEIAAIDKPSFKTNCSFTFDEKDNGKQSNIKVPQLWPVKDLIGLIAFLIARCAHYLEAAQELGVENPPQFTWQGFTLPEWKHDVKALIDKQLIASKKASLEDKEARLNRLVSPEQRRKLELEAIQAEMSAE